MNRIFIHDLRVEARIGVYDWERHLPQTVRLDIELDAPSELPFHSGQDRRRARLRRGSSQRLKAFAKDAPPPLLERFAEKIAQIVIGEFGAPWVKVRVAKLGADRGRARDRRRDRTHATMTAAATRSASARAGGFLFRLGRIFLASIGFVFRIVLVAWATLAIYYSSLPGTWLRIALAVAFLAFGVWALWLTRVRT